MNTRIVEARKDKNMTQKEMASRLGVSAARVNYWEKGKAEPGVAYIFKLCDLLDVSCDWLIGLSPIKKKPVDNINGHLYYI